MTDTLQDFERGLRKHLNAFNDPEPARKARRAVPDHGAKTGWIVTLAVRKKRLATDTRYIFESTSVSRLEAQLEAEKAARKDGWPIVGYVVSMESRAD